MLAELGADSGTDVESGARFGEVGGGAGGEVAFGVGTGAEFGGGVRPEFEVRNWGSTEAGRVPVWPAADQEGSWGTESEVGAAMVRPYAHTGGRTRASRQLAVEALVVAGEWVEVERLSGQQRVIVEMCAQPRSVAEVAALLSVPLGVARVLIGDLADDGVLVVHVPAAAPELDLMNRVLTGLRRL